MTYPLTASLVAATFGRVTNELTNIKTACVAVQNDTGSGAAAPAFDLINLANACITYRADFSAISGNAALLAQLIPYVQNQLAGATALAVTTEYTNLNTLAGNMLTALVTDYPHDVAGHLLDRTFSTTLGVVWIGLTAAQLPNVMPAVTAMLAAMT